MDDFRLLCSSTTAMDSLLIFDLAHLALVSVVLHEREVKISITCIIPIL